MLTLTLKPLYIYDSDNKPYKTPKSNIFNMGETCIHNDITVKTRH